MKYEFEEKLLIVLIAINSISLFGFTTFGLHPQLLARWPWSLSIFAISYPLFARLQIGVAFVTLVVALCRATGVRWLGTFVLVFVLSAGSELLGTTFGIPFGRYEYTSFLGPKIFGKVPWLIPLSWFFMAVPSFLIADLLVRGKSSRWVRIILASLFLLVWDITLDPAMSYLAPFWVWDNLGTYYGMPFLNLVGWFVTGLVLMFVLDRPFSQGWMTEMTKISSRFLVSLYLVNLALPFGMCIAASLWVPVAVTTIIAGGIGAAIFQQSNNRSYALHVEAE